MSDLNIGIIIGAICGIAVGAGIMIIIVLRYTASGYNEYIKEDSPSGVDGVYEGPDIPSLTFKERWKN